MRRATSKKTDKKYILFTELDELDPELDQDYFLMKIKKVIKDASEGLNASSEVRIPARKFRNVPLTHSCNVMV